MYRKACSLAFIIITSSCFAQSIDIKYGKDLDRKIHYQQIRFGVPIAYKEFTLEPYGGWLTWSQINGSIISDDPYSDRYDMGAVLSWQSFYIEFNHFCAHDVYSQNTKQRRHELNGQYQNQSTITFGFKKTFSTFRPFE